MPIQNGERLATKQDLADMYQGILPYLGGMPEMLANKFSKGDLYSTEEKMIGQWIDNNPLYQKTIETIIPSVGVSKVIDSDVTKQLVNYYGYYVNGDETGRRIIPNIVVDSSGKATQLKVTQTYVSGITISTSNQYEVNCNAYITIQYTKTTDSAISIGSDTDYSTEEKIVGTWIDEKPVWQKTLNLGSKTINTSWNDIDLGISSVADMIIKWDAMLYTSSDIYKIPHSADGSYYIGGVITSNKRLSCKAGTTRTGTLIVTVQYTKTTT